MSKQTFKNFYRIARTVAAGNVLIASNDGVVYHVSPIQANDMHNACGQPVRSSEFDAALSALVARKRAEGFMQTAFERVASRYYQYD